MRHGMPLVIAALLVCAGALPAQERIALPPPDSSSAGPSALPASLPIAQAPAPPPGPSSPPSAPALLPPGPYPPPYLQYPPPPGAYPGPAYPPAPVLLGEPDRNPNFWVGAEALLWWSKNQPLSVPVITTGPASQGANAGNLGAPGTVSLNGPLNSDVEGGVRLFAGGWFDPEHTIGLEGSLFFLGRQSAGFGASDRSGTGSFVINEPVVGAPFVTQVSAPGVETGSVAVDATSRLWGGDVNLMYNLYRANGLTVNLLGGYRYLELEESLNIAANSSLFTTTTYTDNMGNTLATAPPGSAVTVLDHFGTRNEFNGGQIGADFQYVRGRWFVGGAAKLAIGATHEVVTVNGTTTVFPVNATPVPLGGGNFANIQSGRYSTDRFALAPEGQLNVGYQITPWLRGLIGYTFLYLSSVARPGNQIDNTYDGMTHPTVPMTSSSYWAQGLTLSFQFSY
jgi:Putative beta barrel porin-7 (BBP7)